MPTEIKSKIIKEAVDKIKGSSGIYFTNYTGMNVVQATDLRKRFREHDVHYVVTKNTLMKIAAKEAGFDGTFDDILKGQIAVAFSVDDPTSPAKIIKDFKKSNKDCLDVVGVVFDGELFDASKYKDLADLPSKEQLLGNFVAAIGQPMSQLAAMLNATMTEFAGVLESLKNSKN